MTIQTVRKSLLLVAAAALAAGGCFKSRASRTTAIISGAAIAAAGVAVMVSASGPGEDTDGDGRDEFPDKAIGCLLLCPLGITLIGGGTGLVVAGVLSETEDAPRSPYFAAPPPAPTTAELRVPPSVQRPLPELSTDPVTIGLAKQARAAAMAGNCATVREVLVEIERRDARYHAALAASNVVDGCR
jgi:hypothetical protein